MSAVAGFALSDRAISNPLPSGRRTSSTMRSGRSAASRTASAAVSPFDYLVAALLEDAREHPAIRQRVVDDQDVDARAGQTWETSARPERPILVRRRVPGRVRLCSYRIGKHQREDRSPTELTLQRDVAAQQSRETPRQREPEPRAFHATLHRILDLRELLEHALEVLRRRSRFRCRRPRTRSCRLPLARRHAHLAALGELRARSR